MEGKEEIILKVALELFLEKGYENTSLNDIVKVTGGSLATIYKKFENKNNLFLKALKFRAEGRLDNLKTMIASNTNLDLPEFLEVFGNEYCNFFVGEDNAKFLRLVLERTYQDINVKKECAKADKDVIIRFLCEVFEKKIKKEILNEISAYNLANLYCSMIRSNKIFDLIFNSKEIFTKDELSEHVKNVNILFLRALR
ncbi:MULTISPECIES: TetR/AcrR family transcriptional regulator [unclassified Campylobacter]|uniref:TetR/AcrR family transcriptional regulator n=1 Tax=unclassified Campylobacter TaxID=2593542 RepID=UPI001D7E8AB8|nr:TetR/AcrR family transcriptional regulator [Campylobacter sp. RM9331]MBZ8005912.1 TetR/AcrR family transcriptional regulator [Campylobacter sp. RM9332]